jgi:acetyl-CoA acyltransferase
MSLERVWITGVGMTPFGVHPGRSVKNLVAQAVGDALRDAGAATSDVGAAYAAITTQGECEGQIGISGHVALRAAGFQGLGVVNVEAACASGTAALQSAVAAVRAGLADIALAVGAEKMHGHEPERLARVFAGGVDVHDQDGLRRTLERLGGEAPGAEIGTRTVFMDIYAAITRAHMQRFGLTQRQLAIVASKNHRHAETNERAHYRKPMSVDEVLAGRPLGWPLTVPMCSPMTDGAAAAIVCNAAGLARLGCAAPVRVLACEIGTGVDREPDDLDRHICRLTAARAYAAAGLGPQDVDVAEVHDAASFGEVFQTELLGFCEFGGGGDLAESGATTIGGRLPVNPSGGLESKGHPIGATGLGQLFELVCQLRGRAGERQVEGARVALAENGGGFLAGQEAVAAVTILGVA